jgi:hypothetical protein
MSPEFAAMKKAVISARASQQIGRSHGWPEIKVALESKGEKDD